MDNKQQNKTPFLDKQLFAGVTYRQAGVTTLGVLAFIFAFGAVGNYDLREEMKQENKRLGYEKYSKEDMPSQGDSATAGALAAISFAGALALANKKENQK